MAVRIRLARYGRKKRPYYRIVVANSESKRDGKFLDLIGTYDPLQNPTMVKLNEERLDHWLNAGATPSDTVGNLIKTYRSSNG
jgi:small subunit ribosomal protein S16